MNFLKYDLGNLKRGQIVEVTLTSGANVRLMSSSDFNSYRNSRAHRYIGGLAKRSPVRMQVPNSGHWYVTVDMQGLKGSTKAGVRVLPSPLPEISDAPLRSVPSLLREPAPEVSQGNDVHDVFISHAYEDKEAIARDLANELKSLGLNVWFDEMSLRIGDSLRQKIDRGLASSRVGLVILSPNFISKGWTNYELDGIVTRSVTGEQILLPIWHNITKQQVMDYSPSIADKVARSTATHTVSEIAREIFDLIRGECVS